MLLPPALLLLLLFATSTTTTTANASLVPTPLMGWSTWEAFAKGLSHENIMRNAKILQSSGLFAKGYKMIQVDDGWMKFNRTTRWVSREGFDSLPRGSTPHVALKTGQQLGCMVHDAEKFPRGMKQLGRDLHDLGFKWGLYTSGEKFFCDAQPGFNPYFASSEFMNLRVTDARCFKDMDVDLMKIDYCQPKVRTEAYVKKTLEFWSKQLGPEIILYNSRYMCMAPTYCKQTVQCPMLVKIAANGKVPRFCTQYSHVARTGPDVKPEWGSILQAISTRFGRAMVSRPGFWSDPDYLVPHPTLLTFQERRSQFAMWCVTSSPLLISTDLSQVNKATLDMLGNSLALEVNQRYEGDAGDLYQKTKNDLWVFRKRFADYFAVVVVNVGRDVRTFKRTPGGSQRVWQPNFAQYAFHGVIQRGTNIRASRCKYTDVWTGKKDMELLPLSEFWLEERESLFLKVYDCTVDGEEEEASSKATIMMV